LVDKSSIGKVSNPRLNPTFRIKGQSVVLHPLEIVSLANESLGELVESLEEEGDAIIAVLDEMLTRGTSQATHGAQSGLSSIVAA
jgi:toxin CcdB